MVWGAFSAYGMSNIVIIDGRLSSLNYIEVLRENLLPLISPYPSQIMLFQQDNCLVHTARATKQWLDSQNIECMNWPSLSPDLNPMENLWVVLSQEVYSNGKQYNTRVELIDGIKFCWNKIKKQSDRILS